MQTMTCCEASCRKIQSFSELFGWVMISNNADAPNFEHSSLWSRIWTRVQLLDYSFMASINEHPAAAVALNGISMAATTVVWKRLKYQCTCAEGHWGKNWRSTLNPFDTASKFALRCKSRLLRASRTKSRLCYQTISSHKLCTKDQA